MTDLVSIVLPVFNVEDYLRECLESIFSQDYKNLEIIAVNDGSTDGSRKILGDYERRGYPISIIDQPNLGLSAARNSAIEAATGEFLMFIDSDDRIAHSAVGLCVTFAKMEGLDCVTFNAKQFGDGDSNLQTDDARFKKSIPAGVFDGLSLFELLLSDKSVWVCAWQFFFRKKFFDTTGLRFREGIIHEDVEFTPRALVRLEKIGFLDNALYHYRADRGGGITTGTSDELSSQTHLDICDRLYSITVEEDLPSKAKDLIERYIVQRYRILLSGLTKIQASGNKVRRMSVKVLVSLGRRTSLRKHLEPGELSSLVTQHLVPELIPIQNFASAWIAGPIRRVYRYQIVRRFRR